MVVDTVTPHDFNACVGAEDNKDKGHDRHNPHDCNGPRALTSHSHLGGCRWRRDWRRELERELTAGVETSECRCSEVGCRVKRNAVSKRRRLLSLESRLLIPQANLSDKLEERYPSAPSYHFRRAICAPSSKSNEEAQTTALQLTSIYDQLHLLIGNRDTGGASSRLPGPRQAQLKVTQAPPVQGLGFFGETRHSTPWSLQPQKAKDGGDPVMKRDALLSQSWHSPPHPMLKRVQNSKTPSPTPAWLPETVAGSAVGPDRHG
jgi:hypothetical protein